MKIILDVPTQDAEQSFWHIL